jgi:hypothetical protein
MAGSMQVYVESGTKRAFAGAVAWPGWCRSGRRDSDALEALVAYAPRYASVLVGSVRGFQTPRSVSDLDVAEQLRGDATTDFGAPSIAPEADARPLDARELKRLISILEGSWAAFDDAVDAATGKELRKAPHGGGRELGAIAGRPPRRNAPRSAMRWRERSRTGFRRRGLAAGRSGCRVTSFAARPGTCSITRGRSKTGPAPSAVRRTPA